MNRGGLFSRRARALHFEEHSHSEENSAARNASRSSEVNKSGANSALMLRMLSGAFPAHRCATSTAWSMPPGRLIPHATDSSRSNRIPARSMARARPPPTSDISSSTMVPSTPIAMSATGMENNALSPATRMSQTIASIAPAPIEGPFTCAMTGTGAARTALSSSVNASKNPPRACSPLDQRLRKKPCPRR